MFNLKGSIVALVTPMDSDGDYTVGDSMVTISDNLVTEVQL